MIKIEIKPLHGIAIDGIGEILLNQSKSEIVQLLSNPSSHSNNTQFYYNQYELRIDFDEHGVSFIEFIYGPYPVKTELSLYSINPFQVGADNLIQLLTVKNNGIIDDSEAGHSYVFLNISVGIWREATEQEIQTSINESKIDGTPIDQIHQLENELDSVKNFWTIGIGRKGYYDDVKDNNNTVTKLKDEVKLWWKFW